MLLKKIAAIIAFVGATFTASLASDKPTLDDFITAFPDVGAFKASQNCYHPEPDKIYAEVKGTRYEVRYVTFTDGQGKTNGASLKEFINSQNLGDTQPSISTVNPYLRVVAFLTPAVCKEMDVYFTMSFKPCS